MISLLIGLDQKLPVDAGQIPFRFYPSSPFHRMQYALQATSAPGL